MNKPRRQSKGTVPRGQSVGLCLQGDHVVCLTSFSLEKPREMAQYWVVLKGSTHPGRETAQPSLPYYLNKNIHAHTHVCTHIHILPTPLHTHAPFTPSLVSSLPSPSHPGVSRHSHAHSWTTHKLSHASRPFYKQILPPSLGWDNEIQP